MDRRKFIAGTVGAVAVGGLVSCQKSEDKKVETAAASQAPAVQTKKVQELKMVTSWPKNFPGLGTSPERFAKAIEVATDGRYKIRVYAGNELVHPLKCLDAVQEGTADMYHSAEYYYKGKTPAFAFFTAVPFGFTANEMDAWLNYGGGQALWDELSADFGVKSFAGTNTGVQMGGWFKKPLTSVEDLKGLKMRMPGLGGDVLNELGATALSLAGSEIMPALQSGTIDATEWVGPWNDLAFGFYKVVKHFMTPGFHEPGSTLSIGISKKFWDGLSKTDQEIFKNCATAENNIGLAEFNANSGSALNTLVNTHGVQVHDVPDDVFKVLGEASADVLSKAANQDAITRKVYDSFLQFHRNVSRWTEISDAAYAVKRSLHRL